VPPVINVHTHYQPESVLPIVEPYGIEMTSGEEGKGWYFRSGDVTYSIPSTASKFWGTGLGEQLPEMDANGIDVHVLQPSPMVFGYHLDPEVGNEFSRAFNNETARHISEHPDRFWGSAQLPMQDLELAAAELERAVTELGLVSCSVGFVLGPDRILADPECDEFLSTAERLDVPILLHPVALGQDLDLSSRGSWLLKYQMD
jgi:predicted TIM-barrel fold metal-dependent hydrolase